jgi:hypothetical protein
VAHACNPSYSGGSDQEDCGSKPAWASSSQDPISKNPSQKKVLVEWLKVFEGPEFKPEYCQNKTKKLHQANSDLPRQIGV